MYYKIAQLMLASNQRANTVSEIFIAQPDANKESLVGKLFVLAELEINKTDGLKLVNFLIDNLNQNYYQNEKILLREKISSLKVDHIFESALAKTNKNFVKFLETEKITINPSLINIIAGVIYKNNLYFSSQGKNKALLIYKTAAPQPKNSYAEIKQVQAPAVYKIADIAKQPEKENIDFNPAKFFTNITSGQIPPNGYLLISNETLPEYLSNKQLIDIITALPPAGAVEQIKNNLSAINAYVPFLGIIIKNTFGEETIESRKIPAINTTSKTSVEKLNTTEEKTEELLSPSGIVNFGKWLGLSSFFKFNYSAKSSPLALKDKIVSKKRASFITLKKIWAFFKNLFFISAKSAGYLFNLFSNKEKAAVLLKNIKTGTAAKCGSSVNWFKSLGKKSKFALIVLTVCVLFLAHNIIALNLNNKKAADEKIYNDLTESIKRKQSQIEANLLYNNEESAKQLLGELQRQISELPQDSEQQKQFYAQISEKYNQQAASILRVAKTAAKELANFANLHDSAEPANIFLLNGTIYSADPKQKSIYNLDLKNNLATEISDLKQDSANLLFPAAYNGSLYYFTGGGILKLDAKSVETSLLTGDFSGSQIAGMESYGGKLYFLDKQKKQILKRNIGTSALGAAQPWLKEQIDLSDAASMSVDGAIYVLKNSGGVDKYIKGVKQDFKLEKIEPELNHADKIAAASDLKYIYILDRADKRLAVFDKAGAYVMQYQPDKLDNIKDFAVDEKGKKIYFLNGTAVYSIDATHIK